MASTIDIKALIKKASDLQLQQLINNNKIVDKNGEAIEVGDLRDALWEKTHYDHQETAPGPQLDYFEANIVGKGTFVAMVGQLGFGTTGQDTADILSIRPFSDELVATLRG